MDFKALSEARYSVRKFGDAPVEAEKLELVLEAGRNAPTAHNYQPQRIFVLESKEALEKADACTASHFHPPIMLVVAYDSSVSWNPSSQPLMSLADSHSLRTSSLIPLLSICGLNSS